MLTSSAAGRWRLRDVRRRADRQEDGGFVILQREFEENAA